MENRYQSHYAAFMRVRWIALISLVSVLASFILLAGALQSELAPMEDRSQFRLQLTAPEGTSFDSMDKYVDRLNNFMLDSVPEKKLCSV